MLKFSELKNRAVVDLDGARKIGNLDNLLIQPTSFQVVGLKVKAGFFNPIELLPLSQLRSVGPDAITIYQPAQVVGESGNSSQVSNTNDSSLAEFPDLKSLIGLQLVSHAGSLLGEVSDVMLDSDKLTITGFEVSQSNLFSKKHILPATPELNFSSTMILVPDEVVNQLGMA